MSLNNAPLHLIIIRNHEIVIINVESDFFLVLTLVGVPALTNRLLVGGVSLDWMDSAHHLVCFQGGKTHINSL